MTESVTPPGHVRLMLVDDHNLFRRGLKALLAQDERVQVLCEAGDMGEALRCLQRESPDVILLDNHLPGVRGVDGIGALKEAAPRVRVLMLTVSEDEKDLAAALQAGADGYLLKTVESDQLIETIFKVLDGESVVSPEMLTKLVAVFRARPPAVAPVTATGGDASAVPAAADEDEDRLADLSPREREICERIGPALRERGLLFVGIDVIDGNLTEINVTSPTGIRAVANLGGPDIAALIWDRIEARRA